MSRAPWQQTVFPLHEEIKLHRAVEQSELATNKERLKTDKAMQKTLKDISLAIAQKPSKTPKKRSFRHTLYGLSKEEENILRRL